MSNNNHEISLQQAIEMTTRYRENRPPNFPLSEKFEVEVITKLISTEGCKFIRIYTGMKENMEAVAILVAVNAEDEDILPSEAEPSGEQTGDKIIVEDGFRCPPVCPPGSPLNGG
ncbi:MAG TPA: hypothetical protein VFW07_00960 [Parafilimonas sp.]|nr:hypothetical protein [Parafilimonas sp.]